MIASLETKPEKPSDVSGMPTPVSESVPIIIIQKVKGISLRNPPIARMSCS